MSNTKDQLTIDFLKELSLVKALGIILLISAAAFGFLIWLIYYKGGSNYSSALIENLPALNALLNAVSAVLLGFGYNAIRQRKYKVHMKFMLTAFFTSTLFLISYVTYHNFHGDTIFEATGIVRPIYFFILITHIILAALVVPLILTSLYFAFSGKFRYHRKFSKITLPVWFYVSVTGVLIFTFLKIFNP